jgi:hypothetical protein
MKTIEILGCNEVFLLNSLDRGNINKTEVDFDNLSQLISRTDSNVMYHLKSMPM